MKTWIAGEVLSASDLNSEFSNILNNPGSLICPIGFNLTITDATYDIGASGATRPRDLYLSRNLIVGGVTSELKRAVAYQWTDYNPSDVIGTATTAPATAAATSTSTSYVTMANSSGTVTFTFVTAGIYQINLNQSLTIAATSTASESYFNIGGSATRYMSTTVLRDQNKLNRISNAHTFLISATANQTLTVQPQGAIVSGNPLANFTFSATASAMYMGNT